MVNQLTNKPENSGFFRTALKFSGSATPKVMGIVFLFICYAVLISVTGHYFRNIALPIGPFEYGGLIMGLILVFRINSGYDRWWEARKLWGNIVNHSRNLCITLNAYINDDNPLTNKWLEKINNYVAAMPFLIKELLRNGNIFEMPEFEQIKDLFDDNDFNTIINAQSPPTVLSSMIAKEIYLAKQKHILDGYCFLRIDEQREQILNAQGACERILKTPMPLVMAIKSRRFILLFLLVLPFALINVSVFLTPLVMFLVAYSLLSLDQISVELQNPFCEENLSHLPLDLISQNILSNLVECQHQLKLVQIKD